MPSLLIHPVTVTYLTSSLPLNVYYKTGAFNSIGLKISHVQLKRREDFERKCF